MNDDSGCGSFPDVVLWEMKHRVMRQFLASLANQPISGLRNSGYKRCGYKRCGYKRAAVIPWVPIFLVEALRGKEEYDV